MFPATAQPSRVRKSKSQIFNAIRFIHTALYQPTNNRRAERIVREVKAVLKKQTEGNTLWKVSQFLFKQHTTPHSYTGKTLEEQMIGRKLMSPLDRLHTNPQRDPVFDQIRLKQFHAGNTVYA